jgi:hypothetical protein
MTKVRQRKLSLVRYYMVSAEGKEHQLVARTFDEALRESLGMLKTRIKAKRFVDDSQPSFL